MTPTSEIERLFRDIPRPEPLAPVPAVMLMRTVSIDEFRQMYPPTETVDADEAINGICAQGESDE